MADGQSYYKTIGGVKYDRSLLTKAEEATKSGPMSLKDAQALWESACDGPGVTDTERTTIEYILEKFKVNAKAKAFLRKELDGKDEPMGDADGDDDEEDEDADAAEGEGDEDEEDEEDEDGDEGAAKNKKGKMSSKVSKTGGATKTSIQAKCNLQFPVSRFAKALRKGGYAKRLGTGASIYLTAVIEYVTAEILELAGNSAKEQKKSRIVPRHIQLAVRGDEELNKYMSNVTISGGGVLPNIHQVLMPQKTDKKGKDTPGASGSMVSQEY
eukprot:TRINITY_DN3423_c0_g1_i3.p2 TRINITY_DN3423_c0_g1~~TRINITY_DN3423_c0_g1_i3.p2  ORF type:complete len:294 (+),score=101.29 TRINITY_DN3423_c0_g1_i3:75-884(+)